MIPLKPLSQRSGTARTRPLKNGHHTASARKISYSLSAGSRKKPSRKGAADCDGQAHVIVRTLGGSWKLQQTGPAVLHRLINKIHTATGLALISDFDTNESWGYHTWPHLTLQDIIDGKRYPLEQSNHPHPELEKYKYPDRSGDRF